jgi:hypothetical protein
MIDAHTTCKPSILNVIPRLGSLGVAAVSTTDKAAVAPGVSNGLFAPARCRLDRRVDPFKPRGKCITTTYREALATY